VNFIGIDPGKGGGLALVGPGGAVIDVVKMPTTERDIYELLSEWADMDGGVFARLEFVRSRPKMSSVAVFTFGWGYGGLRMALVAAGVPFEEVTPAKWQQFMRCLTKGDKKVSYRKAQELFPRQKITHAIADALLIAEYARRNHK